MSEAKQPKHTMEELKQMQRLPLAAKISMTQARVREWVREYGESGVYISFSGGKDSTVLLHIVRELYPDIEAVFVDTGLEYPEIKKFVKTFDNVTILHPEMRFDEVVKKYGYPMISKSAARKINAARCGEAWARKYVDGTAVKSDGGKSFFTVKKYAPLLSADFIISSECCDVMKKKAVKKYAKAAGKNAITAQMAVESKQRMGQWLIKGCNSFDSKNPISNPMSFWTTQDILQFIKINNIPIASVYGNVEFEENGEQTRIALECGWDKLCTTGCDRTGCIFCGFGAHLEKGETRFERLKRTHPKQYAYCMGGGEYDERGLWVPNKQGLGMKHVIDELNKLYGDDFIKY